MEKKVHNFLVDWTVNFVKNKDAISKKIEQIENGKDGFDLYVKYKDKEQYFIVLPKIADVDSIIKRIGDSAKSDASHFSIVTLNSKVNFEAMLKNWNMLAEFRLLNITFINPFSGGDKKWGIYPYIHNKVCDESSLKSGLKAMFETVEQIEEQELAENIRG